MNFSDYVTQQLEKYQARQVEWGAWWTLGSVGATVAAAVAPMAVLPMLVGAGIGATKYLMDRPKVAAFQKAYYALRRGDVEQAQVHVHTVERGIWWAGKREGASPEAEQARLAFNLRLSQMSGTWWQAMGAACLTAAASIAAGPVGAMVTAPYLLYRGRQAIIDGKAGGQAERAFKAIDQEERLPRTEDTVTLSRTSHNKSSILPDLDVVGIEPATPSVRGPQSDVSENQTPPSARSVGPKP